MDAQISKLNEDEKFEHERNEFFDQEPNEEEEEDEDDYEEEEDDEDDDELYDNLIDAEELNNFKKLQDSNKTKKLKKSSNQSLKSSQNLADSSPSQNSLANDENNDDDDDESETQSQKRTEPHNLLNGVLGNDTRRKKSTMPKLSLVDDNGRKFRQINALKTAPTQISYAISAENFVKFEESLFDVLGLTGTSFKLDSEPTVKRSSACGNRELETIFRSKLVSNMETIEKSLELNALSQLQLKQHESKRKQRVGTTKKGHLRNENQHHDDHDEENDDEFKSKIVTVILNQTARPRKAGRILLTRKNSTHLDNVLSELTGFFKNESVVQIRKLFNLKGVQILNVKDFFNNDDVFLAFSNDKVHNRDFELDNQEIELIYANEFMKTYSHLKPEDIYNNNLHRNSTSHSHKKTKKADSKLDTYSDDILSMPKELLDNYEVGSVIGEGNYALVRECKDINTGIKFALKIIDLKKCIGKEEMIENELEILKKVKHPNITKLVEDYRSNDFVYMILEFYRGGDLLEALTKHGGKYTENEAYQILHSLASAVSYLHSVNIVHRDIKLENILIQQHKDNSISLKLGDFGLATVYTGPLNQKCGSPIYVAPEILLENSYGFEVDIWSLGIIAYVLLCGYAPFQGETDEETFRLIKNEELKFPKQDWAHIAPENVELIRKMLDRDQSTRIKANEVLDYKWVLPQTSSKPTERRYSKQPRKSVANSNLESSNLKARTNSKAINNFKRV